MLGPGQNGGWAWREGTIPGPRAGQTINGANETNATLVAPLFEYGRGLGAAIIGGFVFPFGTNYPSLNGTYLFGDYIYGSISSLHGTNAAATFTRLTGGLRIVAFLPDPANGDVLVLDRGEGKIKRLVAGTSDDSAFPQTLTATGFFANLSDLHAESRRGVLSAEPPLLVGLRGQDALVPGEGCDQHHNVFARRDLELSRTRLGKTL